MIGADVPGASWCDIDTMADLDAAETLIRADSDLVLPKPQSVLSGEGRLVTPKPLGVLSGEGGPA